jgi:hypothetical protein
MKEIYEFRVQERFAHRLFDDNEGKKLGPGQVRKILISPDDPRFAQIGEIHAEINNQLNTYFFAGWQIHRRYSQTELRTSKAFSLLQTSTFEPAGEECGTAYDESKACPRCGAGAVQVSDLRLDLRKAPRGKDVARTIAGENIVSQRLAQEIVDARLKGVELRRVRHKARYEDDPLDLSEVPTGRRLLLKAEAEGFKWPEWEFYVWLNRPEQGPMSEKAWEEHVAYKRLSAKTKGKRPPVWYQLIVTSQVNIVPPTCTGIKPFVDDIKGEHRCPYGDTIGLNLLSELSISRLDFEKANADIVETRQYIGTRRGLLRPERRLIISPRFREVLVKSKVKGHSIEVVHLI